MDFALLQPRHKLPISVLVVVYAENAEVLLLERAKHPGYWQSVTGSLEPGETFFHAAKRELEEETGIHPSSPMDAHLFFEYEIYPQWRHRYPPGVVRNHEHVFYVRLLFPCEVILSHREHRAYRWLSAEIAKKKVFSWTNAQAIANIERLLQQER